MRKITILDIANELNITFSTVARALNDHPGISEATKQAVKETAERLNYRRNKVASSLRSGKTNIVGIVVPSFHVTFFSSIVYGIERVMNENGYHIILSQSHESCERESEGIETLLQSRVDGIIASMSTETTDYNVFREVMKRNIPLIFFDRVAQGLDVPSVNINDYKGGFMATEHLILQGYKNIVHITAAQDINIFNERLRGYLDALSSYNIPINEDLIVKGKFSLEFGKSVVKDLKLRSKPFDAIFALEDYTAMGAMRELVNEKVKVPEDVGVIGFANEAFGELVSPQLSTIDQQSIKMGEEAAKLFLKITGKLPSIVSTPFKVVLDPLLIVRNSSNRSPG